MRHFATESGKSKGQFYTPAEVSRIMAQVLGIRNDKTSSTTTVYDPTCGSGSLLLKVVDQATTEVTPYGQEKDLATSGLARMNMILHHNPTAEIIQGNTLTDPKFKDGGTLKQFDYVVANPPFSDKRWSNGLDALNDPFERFKSFGVPPDKQGDYAYLLHIVRSLKSTGRGACILPHGVLFRGNAEAEIRKNLLQKGYIEGIIGLPANLFYGTGIPACIIVIDKRAAQKRNGIFMVDASQGFMKDGPKNRLRERDIHRIVDAYTKRLEMPKYSRLVPMTEIEKNEFNLNLPRYIDSQEAEDLQDIAGHLQGGIPEADLQGLAPYWEVCPGLRKTLFKPNRKGYVDLAVDKAVIQTTIFDHKEFVGFRQGMTEHFATWRKKVTSKLKGLGKDCQPKKVIEDHSEGLLHHYEQKPLVDAYAVYQHLLELWSTVMQDDCYLISADGWKAEPKPIVEKDKKGNEKVKGWGCDLVPKDLVVKRFFAKDQEEIDNLTSQIDAATAGMEELEEEHGGEEGYFGAFDKVNKASVATRIKEIQSDKDAKDELAVLKQWDKLNKQEADLKKKVKEAEAGLDEVAKKQYAKLTEADVKALVVDDKWLHTLEQSINGELDRVSQGLTKRVKELAERYESTLPNLTHQVADLEKKVAQHLERMGFTWK
jgi:type I restriction enzyme M protein